MNIDQVRTFLEIVKTNNFNRAADNLNITQSTVSSRIRVLEERLGQPLFLRNHTGAQLTPAGERFRRYALNLQRLWYRAEQEVALPSAYRATIGLGSQVSLWDRLILRWLPKMRLAAPDIAIHVEADYSASLMRQLTDGILDIGVMYVPRQMPGLVIEDLLVEKFILVSTQKPDTSVSWQDSYVFIDWGPEFGQVHDETFPDLSTPISVGLGDLGLRYILQEGGCGYFPARVVHQLVMDQVLFHVPDTPVMQRQAYVVYGASVSDPDLLDLGLNQLRDVAKEGEMELAQMLSALV